MMQLYAQDAGSQGLASVAGTRILRSERQVIANLGHAEHNLIHNKDNIVG